MFLDLFLLLLDHFSPEPRVLEVAGWDPVGIFPDELFGRQFLAATPVVDQSLPVDVVSELVDELRSEAVVVRELLPVPVVLELFQQLGRNVLLLQAAGQGRPVDSSLELLQHLDAPENVGVA